MAKGTVKLTAKMQKATHAVGISEGIAHAFDKMPTVINRMAAAKANYMSVTDSKFMDVNATNRKWLIDHVYELGHLGEPSMRLFRLNVKTEGRTSTIIPIYLPANVANPTLEEQGWTARTLSGAVRKNQSSMQKNTPLLGGHQ